MPARLHAKQQRKEPVVELPGDNKGFFHSRGDKPYGTGGCDISNWFTERGTHDQLASIRAA